MKANVFHHWARWCLRCTRDIFWFTVIPTGLLIVRVAPNRLRAVRIPTIVVITKAFTLHVLRNPDVFVRCLRCPLLACLAHDGDHLTTTIVLTRCKVSVACKRFFALCTFWYFLWHRLATAALWANFWVLVFNPSICGTSALGLCSSWFRVHCPILSHATGTGTKATFTFFWYCTASVEVAHVAAACGPVVAKIAGVVLQWRSLAAGTEHGQAALEQASDSGLKTMVRLRLCRVKRKLRLRFNICSHGLQTFSIALALAGRAGVVARLAGAGKDPLLRLRWSFIKY
mmetsp:Transcript_27638/g.48045  ORF Transcript_27638/g.48045 Transcript_27638/m.48045 type:complete len:286 (+) Transcript_27638:195-1052(+)